MDSIFKKSKKDTSPGDNDDIMQYLDINIDLLAGNVYDNELSEDGSVRSDLSSQPSPADVRYDSLGSLTDTDDQKCKRQQETRQDVTVSTPVDGVVEVSDDFRVSFARSQQLLQSLIFGCKAISPSPRCIADDTHKQLIKVVSQQGFMPHNFKYRMLLAPLPERSRVEIQIMCRILIYPSPEEHLLKLPRDIIARPRLQLQDELRPDPQILCLDVEAFIPETPEKPIYMCSKCIAREKKRAFRKKTRDLNEDNYWDTLNPRRLLIFNCREVISLPLPKKHELSTGEIVEGREIELPLRIACYCRHHAAKSGYKLLFALRDSQNNVVGSTVSDSIFITDHHKDSMKFKSKNDRMDKGLSVASYYFDSSSDTRTKHHHPYSRDKRSSSIRMPECLSSHASASSSTASAASSIASVTNSLTGAFNAASNSALCNDAESVITGGLDTINAATSMSHIATSLRNGSEAEASFNIPVIQRVIPASGSVRGGFETTLLGQNFRPGLVAIFGDMPAISTQFWSSNTIIAHLPPSNTAGPVLVHFQNHSNTSTSAVFTYVNDSEAKLMQLALQVVGFKMNGRIEDATDVAMRIFESNQDEKKGFLENASQHKNSQSNLSIPEGFGNFEQVNEETVMDVLAFLNKPGNIPNMNMRNTEGQTMMHLASIAGFSKVTKFLISRGSNVDIQDVSGFTPIHFAAYFGHKYIVELLLAAEADPFHRTGSGHNTMELADEPVRMILPSDQRKYYQELNMRSLSSSSLVSLKNGFDYVPTDSMVDNYGRCATREFYIGSSSSADEEDAEFLNTVRRLHKLQTPEFGKSSSFVKFLSTIAKRLMERENNVIALQFSPPESPRIPPIGSSCIGKTVKALMSELSTIAKFDTDKTVSDVDVPLSGSTALLFDDRSGLKTGELSMVPNKYVRQFVRNNINAGDVERELIDEESNDGKDPNDAEEDDDEDPAVNDAELLASWNSSPLKQIQNDYMLFTFWLPLLVLAMSYTVSMFMALSPTLCEYTKMLFSGAKEIVKAFFLRTTTVTRRNRRVRI